jgi:hypothetical protein|tara:strand:- start:378 stop:512 length:135 start_codon:yes stop_codon:yes gene_type:complete
VDLSVLVLAEALREELVQYHTVTCWLFALGVDLDASCSVELLNE